MKKLLEQTTKKTKAVSEVNPRIRAYLESDMRILSPIFYVQGVHEHEGATNYVMTSLIKAYKEQHDTNVAPKAKASITTVRAFEDSTKNSEGIHVGIKECERLSLIKCDRAKGEIILLDKCFNTVYVI